MPKTRPSLDSHIHDVLQRAIEGAIEAARADIIEQVTRALGGEAVRQAGKAKRSAGKRTWPSCSVAGCDRRVFGPSADKRLCYPHYLESGGKHPAQAGEKRAGGGAKKSGKRAASGRRSEERATADAILVEQVFEVIQANPGLRAEQIIEKVGAKREPVKAALATLRESSRVKVAGKARGTTYTA